MISRPEENVINQMSMKKSIFVGRIKLLLETEILFVSLTHSQLFEKKPGK